MSERRQKNQLELAFMTGGRSEASRAVGEGTESPVAERKTESPAISEPRMEKVIERGNLREALRRVKANKGSPGVDGMTVDELVGYLKEHWPAIRDKLLSGTYRPQPVKRVEISPDGGVRKLGIPAVLDRFIQQAAMQVLQRRWDPMFSRHSYGFRPVLQSFDEWVRHRLRATAWKQWKQGRTRFAELRKRGVGKDLAAQTASSAHGPWRLANSPALNMALPNAYFSSLGLPTLAARG